MRTRRFKEEYEKDISGEVENLEKNEGWHE